MKFEACFFLSRSFTISLVKMLYFARKYLSCDYFLQRFILYNDLILKTVVHK